jgi:hypothetical protein
MVFTAPQGVTPFRYSCGLSGTLHLDTTGASVHLTGVSELAACSGTPAIPSETRILID